MSHRESQACHGAPLTPRVKFNSAKWVNRCFQGKGVDLDPLDLEILERALEGALTTIKEKGELDDLETDADPEAALCAELIDIALSSGLPDAEALGDAALALPQNVAEEG